MQKLSLTVTFAQLTAAATTQTLTVGLLPAGAVTMGQEIALTTPFTGGAISAVTVSVGPTAAPTQLVNAANVLAAAINGKASTAPAGTGGREFGGQSIVAVFTSTGANVNAATAGSLKITVYYTILP